MSINYQLLHNYCNSGIKTLRKLGHYVQCTENSGYTFIDRHSDILAIAHIDTVQNSRTFHKNENRVFSPRLDDRLGVYTLMHQLSDLSFDVLLTEDEESMMSTAVYFDSDKHYKWLFQFDRSGIDAVMYQYHNTANSNLLKQAGYSVGIGSYTDICELDHLNCSGFNFGTAYYKPHSLSAYMLIDEYLKSVERFRLFYAANKDSHLPFEPEYHTVTYDRVYDKWDNWDYISNDSECPVCNMRVGDNDLDTMYVHGMCSACYTWLEKWLGSQS